MQERLPALPFKDLPPIQQNKLLHNAYNQLAVQQDDIQNNPFDLEIIEEMLVQRFAHVPRRQASGMKPLIIGKAEEYVSHSKTTRTFQQEFLRLFSIIHDYGKSPSLKTPEETVLDRILGDNPITGGIFEEERARSIEKLAFQTELYFYMQLKETTEHGVYAKFIDHNPDIQEILDRNKEEVNKYLKILMPWRSEYREKYSEDPFDF